MKVDIQLEYDKWFELTKNFYKLEILIKNKQRVHIESGIEFITAELADQLINSVLELEELENELEVSKVELEVQNNYLSELLNKIGNTKIAVLNKENQSIWLLWNDGGKIKHIRH